MHTSKEMRDGSDRIERLLSTDGFSRIVTADGLLLMCDFDGTLTPISADPLEPTITPGNYRSLRRLATVPRTRVAIVSGRALDDLVPRIGLRGITYAGNHGLELLEGDTVTVHPDAAQIVPAIRKVRAELARRVDSIPGCWIEDKRLSLTVHYRQTPSESYPALHAELSSLVSRRTSELRFVRGKESLEVRPAVDWDKGSIVRYLQRRHPPEWVSLYLGDDTTDEDAFRALRARDVGVLVGSGETDASHRISDQRSVRQVLDAIVDARQLG